jgi:hypothetical protein
MPKARTTASSTNTTVRTTEAQVNYPASSPASHGGLTRARKLETADTAKESLQLLGLLYSEANNHA